MLNSWFDLFNCKWTLYLQYGIFDGEQYERGHETIAWYCPLKNRDLILGAPNYSWDSTCADPVDAYMGFVGCRYGKWGKSEREERDRIK